MNQLIATKKLKVGYAGKTVVEGVDVDGLKGQIICLLGPNGVGKTTILRTLSGLLAPVEGTVEIGGENIDKANKNQLAKTLSVVLTSSSVPSLLTVSEIVAMGRTPYTGFFGRLSHSDKEIVENAIALVGAEHLKERYYTELSDGEKQKVMIARALAQEPKLIVLDEPTSHLDIRHKVEVVRILNKLARKKGITVILSLHDIDLAIKGCQTIIMVQKGKVVSVGTPEDIIKDGTIGDLYSVSGAKYIELLGSVEVMGESKEERVFVVSGSGSGIKVFRALSRNGYAMMAGVLHENDVDYQVASCLCVQTISENPFDDISKSKLERALDSMKEHEIVVDAGFYVGHANVQNIEMINTAIALGKKVYSLRNKTEANSLYKQNEKVVYCESISDLLNKLKGEDRSA